MNASGSLALVRLLRLASPALPVGAFGYSQGLETAIRSKWVRDETSLHAWMLDVLTFNLARFEAVLLARLHAAWQADDVRAAAALNEQLCAARETAELRAESLQMGASLRALFAATGEFGEREMAPLSGMLAPAFATVFAFAGARWNIDARDCVVAYLFAWAENQVAAAMKCMRLGHVAAQRILVAIDADLVQFAEQAVRPQAVLSNFAPALTIASAVHETQDSRLFRS